MSNICVGRPIIEILAKEGAWCNSDGDCVIAADDLHGNNPYAELDRLRAEVARLQTGLEQVEHVAMHSYREAFDLVSALLAETAPAPPGKEE